jgi:hypothetical protein
MLSTFDREYLLKLCESFKCSDDVNLAHLIDAVNTTIPDHSSPDWKACTSYMDHLNEAWTQIVKENEEIPWPEVNIPILISFLALIL